MLRILAGASLALLIYEGWSLAANVLLPLLGNPTILQTDFHYYYDAAVRFRDDPARLYLLTDDPIVGFTYPPPAILPFVLLSYLPFGAALVVQTVSSYAAVLAAAFLWLRYLQAHRVPVEWKSAVAAVMVAVAMGPVYSNAIFGQVNAWVLLCAVVFVTAGPSRAAVGGAFLAAGTLLKIYPVLTVAIGLWDRGAWRRIIYAAVAGLVLIAIALPIVPLDTYRTFVADVIAFRIDKTAVHILNQSLIAFLERFSMPPERFLNWTGEQAVDASQVVRVFNLLFGVAVIGLLWHRASRDPRDGPVSAAAGLIALPAVIAPLGWGHTYVLVLPLVVLHLVRLRDASAIRAGIIAMCVAALLIPAGRRFGFVELLPVALQNVVYSRYLFATVLLIVLRPGSRG